MFKNNLIGAEPITDMATKTVLMLFSGGLDSVALAFHYMSLGWAVEAAYVNGGQGQRKMEAELIAVRKLIALLESKEIDGLKDLEGTFKFIGTYDVSGIASLPDEDAGFTQPLFWVTALVRLTNAKYHEVAMAYVLGDQMSSSLSMLSDAYHNLVMVSKNLVNYPALVFPLMFSKKRNLLDDLPPELLAEIWTCESPTRDHETGVISPCGSCSSCLSLEYARADFTYEELLAQFNKTIEDEEVYQNKMKGNKDDISSGN